MVERVERYDSEQVKQARASIVLALMIALFGAVWSLCLFANGNPAGVAPVILCLLPAVCFLSLAVKQYPELYFAWRVQRDFEKTCQGVGLSGTGSYLSSWKGIAKYGLLDITGKGRANGIVLHPKFHNLAGNFEQWSADITPLYGQSVDDYSAQADTFALAFGVPFVNFERAKSGYIRVRAGSVLVPETYEYPAQWQGHRDDDTGVGARLQPPLPQLDTGAQASLQAVPMAVDIDGNVWHMPIESQHVIVTGRTGSGKGSYIWGLVFGLENARKAGLVRLWACDPKRVELALGRHYFYKYADSAAGMVELIEAFLAEMQARGDAMQGRIRKFTPSVETPLNILLIDELAYITSLLPDKKLKERAVQALTTILTQGRAIGYSVFGAIQDPRKETLPNRDSFPIRIALGLAEKQLVDMVLGDGMHDAGALCEQLPLGDAGAGCAYVVSEDSAKPLLVRAAWISDEAIKRKLGAPADAPLETPPLAYPAYEQGYVPQLGFDGQPFNQSFYRDGE